MLGLLLAAWLVAASGASAYASSDLAPLKVVQNQLQDSAGNQVHLTGIDRSGTEYACIQGWGIFSGPSDNDSVTAMASWHINAVRIPLNEDCWLGINMGTSVYGGAAYRTAITNYVNLLHVHGIYAILALVWSAPGVLRATAQGAAADADHSPAFWTSVATTFLNYPAVLFDLFGEPVLPNWNTWLTGGAIAAGAAQNPYGSFLSVGMQSLVSAVRATGAIQPVMVGGLHYSNDMSGWLANLPSDPLNQVIASVHLYNFTYPCNTSACYDSGTYSLAAIAAAHPVVFGEIGENDCAHGFIDQVMPWADSHGYSYLGWAWTVADCAGFPSLISNYNGTPTNFGVGFRDHLASGQPFANLPHMAWSPSRPLVEIPKLVLGSAAILALMALAGAGWFAYRRRGITA